MENPTEEMWEEDETDAVAKMPLSQEKENCESNSG